MLQKHHNSQTHKQAMVSWKEYKQNVERGTTIENRLDSARMTVINENRHYMTVLMEVILLCARQNLALHGHCENESSHNRGNFLEILQLIAKLDETVEARLRNDLRNASYTLPSIQNTVLHILGSMVRKEICTSMRNAGVYSILVDETKDCSKTKQLSISVRYVDDNGTIQEHF